MLYDFLARDFYEHCDETFFAGIHKLPPGSWMVVRDGKPGEARNYWNLAAEVKQEQVSADPQEREEKLLNLCEEAVDWHLRSDVPVGVALSGGLDSATLLALLDKTHPDPVRVEAFSVAFAEAAYSEKPYVETLTSHLVITQIFSLFRLPCSNAQQELKLSGHPSGL
jgi:asparagine synthase (glutamine-hydrolysing)